MPKIADPNYITEEMWNIFFEVMACIVSCENSYKEIHCLIKKEASLRDQEDSFENFEEIMHDNY